MVKRKETNTHKFKGFSERISAIKIDVTHRIQRSVETPENEDTFFYEALSKWTELNCTLHFQNFSSQVKEYVQSLAQLVYHKERVIDLLKRHLEIRGSLALESLLDLVVQLAKDLQGDFYPHFGSFLSIFVSLLNRCWQDVGVLECIFTTLSYLFKFLWRHMVRNISSVFSLYSPLLMVEQKYYIQQFAAESFSFLMRKVKDTSHLFDVLFSALDTQPDLCQGLGFLCFEMIKGVKHQFHSMTDAVLPVLFSKLGAFKRNSADVPWSLHWELVFNSLVHMLERMAKHSAKEHCQVVEESLFQELKRLIEIYNKKQLSDDQKGSLMSQMSFVLSLTDVWVSWKSGSLISDPVNIINVVQVMLVGNFSSDIIAPSWIKLASTLLLGSFTEPSRVWYYKQLIMQLFDMSVNLEQFFTFCRRLLRWENFQKHMLPLLLNQCQSELLKSSCNIQEVVLMLTEVIVHSTTADISDLGLGSLKGALFFPNCGSQKGGQILKAFLDNLKIDETVLVDKSRLPLIWGTLVCIPCIRPLDIPQCCSQLISLIQTLSKHLLSTKIVTGHTSYLSVLSQAIQSYSLIVSSAEELTKYLDYKFMLTLLRSWPEDVHILQACLNMVTVARTHGIQSFLAIKSLQEIYPYVRLNLCSASHIIRLFTLKILSCFDQPERHSLDEKTLSSEMSSVFQLCLSAEEIPVHLETYRDRLVCLQKLRFSASFYDALPKFCREAALLHLSGMLCVNFSPLWDPVIEIIASFAQTSNVKHFWETFSALLNTAAENAEKELSEEMDTADSQQASMKNSVAVDSKPFKCLDEIFNEHNIASLGSRQDNRADHTNVRYLLWKAMVSFPEISEQKSRDLVPLFLRFVSNEYFVVMENVAPSQDILAKQSAEPHGATLTDQPDQSGSREIDADNSASESQNNAHKKRHRAATKSLCVHLSLFTAFRNPKALFKESEMRQLFLRFLTHREGKVQKLAVKCLMTYKFGYLEPYKENIERLLDDENFRDELAHFSVDEESGIVDVSHREGLMPVLIRLLYGKMQRWTGTGTGGKAGIGARRAVVLRFLASCPQQEIQIFMDLIFAPFKADKPSLIITTEDLSSVVPLKKQQGFLGMVSQILSKIGILAASFHPSMLQIILSLLSTCVLALKQREKVQPSLISQLKTVRQLAITRLIEFFELMPDYDFKPICDTVFSSAVWPQLEKLYKESIQHPTPLLKLLSAWSNNPRYFPLLSRKPVENPDLSIMSCVFACLRVPSVAADVAAMVMEMTDNLLSGEMGDKESDLIECGSELTISSNYNHGDRPDYGTLLVLPHISEILEYLNRSVKQAIENSGKNKGKVVLPQRELSVLSKISPFVKDAEQSATLISMLLPFVNSSQKEETVNNILTTIKSLLTNVDSPRDFVTPLSKLFSQLNARSTRQCLCDVFLELANVDSGFSSKACELLSHVNAWNPKRLDEPDYDTRLAAFANAKVLIQESALKTEEILPLLHNCIHFVLCSEDLSVRDSAGSCMSCIVRFVVQRSGEKDEAFHFLIMKCLLPACKKALFSKKEIARNEFLGVLSTMVREFEHDSLSDLKVLLDEDPEKDFFENIKHIQLHRRIRALRRLQSHCQQHSLRTTTLTAFLLPLVTHCVFDHTAAKEHNLVTEAVTTIGTISASLPWSKYSSLLRHYLKLLPIEKNFRKVIVRIVVIILNNFNYDLSTVPKQLENLKLRESSAGNEGNNVESKKKKKDNSIKIQNEGGNKHDGDNDGDDDNEDDNDDDDDEEETAGKGEMANISKEELAVRIYNTITSNILPQLHKCVTKKSKSDHFHRLSQQKAEDEEEVLRVPVILAIIKLLQALPEHVLHLHLPGLLLRVCHTLRSRAREVRDAARDTLAKITVSLGTQYFSFILKELRSSLTRGYQLHVLSFTLHTLLDKMSDNLVPGDLDPSLQGLVEVLVEDLFGEVATEREVEKIANKIPEAKTCKSFDTFEILAKYAGTQSLTLLVSPLKEVLDSTQSHKTARRVEEVLRRIGVGLQANPSVTPQILLIFIHGLTHDNIPLLKPKPVEKKDTSVQPDPRLHPASSLLLPANPTRGGNVPQTSTKTNHHILVEFGLQLLYMMLKHGKISMSDQDHLRMLDPFVELLSNCLKSKYNKVVTISLRCVSWLVKFPLPSLTRCVPAMGKQLFKLLKTYAKAGAKIGENFEMVLSAFKAMTVIIRDFKQYTVAEKHLQVLLGFVEEDIHDHTKQGTAFPLLKAILSRKLVVPEIHDIMSKVGQLSITGSSPSVQLQSRQCMLQFLLDYPLGNKLQRYLEFYVSQLGYEHETGRESALEMLASMFSSFPEEMLFDYAGFFFIPLTSRLVNDDSAGCRKLTALVIKSLLEKLDADQRHKLFSIVLLWFKDEKISLQRLAAQVCGLFVEVEGKNFERRLATVLPIVASVIAPEQYETENPSEDEDHLNSSRGIHRIKDHLLFNTLSLLAKIIKECQVIKNPSRQQDMANIWESVEAHLLHPHAWVRLVSSRLLGLLFAAWKPEELVTGFQKGKTSIDYLQENLPGKVAKLCEDMCSQLRSPLLENELGEQIVKNLVFLAKTLHLLYRESDSEVRNGEDKAVANRKNANREEEETFTLKDLLSTMNKLATLEASQTPKHTQKRSCVLRWLAAVSIHLGKDDLELYLVDIVSPVYRELEVVTTYKDADLKTLAQEVLDLIKSLVGREAFSRTYASLQQTSTETRETRKRKKALEAVADPAKSARKKLKKNLAKKETRKRKIDSRKPERKFKEPRMQEI